MLTTEHVIELPTPDPESPAACDLRGRVMRTAAELGYPPLALTDGEYVHSGRPGWELFTSTAENGSVIEAGNALVVLGVWL